MISVVIPLYNKEKSIYRTLDSVLAQTYRDYECLIVNDGSIDNSLEVVKDWLKKKSVGSNFHLIIKENGGVSSARNRGIEEAIGDYIAFLDGDDYWEPTYLEELQKLIIDFPEAGIYGLGYGDLINGVKKARTINLFPKHRGVVVDVWRNNLMLYWTSSCCSSRDNLISAGCFNTDLTYGEDLDMWFRLMLKGPAVFYNKTLAYYVLDAENRAMNRMPAIENHIVSIIDKYKGYRQQDSAFRKAFDTQMIYFLYEFMFTPYRKQAKQLAKQLDYHQLKWSLHFRMKYPDVYRLLVQLKSL